MALMDSAFIEGGQFVPTVFLYDNFPGGVGLSEPLWQRQAELVTRATELVQRCDCSAGCPACVGPALAAHEGPGMATPRSLALEVLGLLAQGAVFGMAEAVETTGPGSAGVQHLDAGESLAPAGMP
jgi:hypothetical protein